MIEVSGLTKRYVGHTAVDDITFAVKKGEIVGFLGPNGAGKSTTIRMLTCFLTPTSGKASVGGFDIEKDSIKVRQMIGYMPENVPLYPDMRVHEYLKFRGALKGLKGKGLADGVDESIEVCSLREMENRIIATLSKGYRQRVGLADALVNKPDLLILDEPTNGLDPQQIRQFRELIKDLGKQHTIFLSTHILPEVEMTCSRVLIINQGKLRASDTPKNLVKRLREGTSLVMEIKTEEKKVLGVLRKLNGVATVDSVQSDPGWVRFEIMTSGKQGNVAEKLFELAVERNWKVRELSRRDASLEDAFVDLVKKDVTDKNEVKSK